ncbi:MAG: FMN-binding negative transcriptional regulator, partial [Maricaulaceae bacterium]
MTKAGRGALLARMYPAPSFHETDPERVLDLFEAHPLALVFCAGEAGPRASHVPVIVDRAPRRLRFHLSGNNPLVGDLVSNGRCLIVASGPNAYVSPDWYGREDQLLGDDGADGVLDDLSTRQEEALAPKPIWTREKMSPGRYEKMRDRIRAFAVVPDRLEAIFKLSQNRPADARAGVIEGLENRARPGDVEIAALMRAL